MENALKNLKNAKFSDFNKGIKIRQKYAPVSVYQVKTYRFRNISQYQMSIHHNL